MRQLTYPEAVNEALREEMRRDSRVFCMGIDALPTDNGAMANLAAEFGEERVRLTPISEEATAGAAIGAAMAGMRPIAGFALSNFAMVAFDQIVNHAATFQYMFGGQARLPIVYRMSIGAGGGAAAQHSMNPYGMFINIPGLKILLPSTPYDLKGLLKTAIRDDNPVMCFETAALWGVTSQAPEEEYTIAFGQADVKREGSDVTVVALAGMVPQALRVAGELADEGVSVEVVDPRTLVPLDIATILASVRKTGRLVVVDQAPKTGSAAGEIASLVCEDADTFRSLRSPVQRVCALDCPMPYAAPLERYVLPDRPRIAAAIKATLS